MKPGISLGIVALFALCLAASTGGSAQAEGVRTSGDTIPVLVTFRDDFDSDGSTRDRHQEEDQEDQLVESRGGHVKRRYDITEAVAIEVDRDDYSALVNDPRVERVEPDVPVRIVDAELDSSWGVKKVGSESNHLGGYKGDGVKVGVLDTGINRTHVDLAANYDASCSYDFVNNDSDPMDDNGHGSHVSGIIAALDNNTGVIGMAPDATICSYKVLAANGGGSYSAILAALDRALDDGVDVVNLSLGSGYPGSSVQQAFANAYAQGLTIVAAAGNSSSCSGTPPPPDNEIYPAAFPNVIAVASTDSADNRSCFSSVGPDVEIAAPGSSIVAPWYSSNTAYVSASGTSMATPHVAGLVAVLLGCNGALTNAQVTQIIDSTALDLDSPVAPGFPDGRDTWFGFGRIRASNAATAAGCGAGAPSTSTPTPTRTNTPVNTPTHTPTRTNTPLPPTATNTALPPTATRTNTPVLPSTSTTTPVPPTATRTNTAVPPTATRTNTALPPTATRTNTPLAPTATRTNTPQPPTATRTNTPLPPTATRTPTRTPIVPSSTPTSAPFTGSRQFLFSLGSSATLNNVTFENEDIVAWNGAGFSLFFDGSDVMSTQALIDGFAVVGSRDVLVTFASSGSVRGVAYDPADILRFSATTLGTNTSGMWSMYFDGSDVGLTTANENVDGIEMLPMGQLLLSTQGEFSVTGASGDDKDILKFTPTMLGNTTNGSWQHHFDGGDVGLTTDAEDIDGLAVSSSGSIYLSTTGEFGVTGLSGQDEDVFVFAPTALGATTTGSFVSLLFFDGSSYGLSLNDIVDIDLP